MPASQHLHIPQAVILFVGSKQEFSTDIQIGPEFQAQNSTVAQRGFIIIGHIVEWYKESYCWACVEAFQLIPRAKVRE